MRRTLAMVERTGTKISEAFVISTLCNFQKLLTETGNLADAEPLAWRALTRTEKLHGADHPEYGYRMESLAWLRYAQGDFQGAELLLREALSIRERTSKPNHPGVALTMVDLAIAASRTSSAGDAEALARRTLLVCQDVLGSQHPSVGLALLSLARILQRKDRFEEAEPFCRRALSILEKSGEAESLKTANTIHMLAKSREAIGDLRGARLLLGRAYDIAGSTVGRSYHSTKRMERQLNRLMILTMTPSPSAVN